MVEYEQMFSIEEDESERFFIHEIDVLTAGWSEEEMIELLGECEFILSQNEGRLAQLDVRGLKRLWHVITGIKRKNEQEVRRNVQEIQKISFQIQKIVLKRINYLSKVVRGLNDKLNEQAFWTQETIDSLCEKIDRRLRDVEVMNRLLMWCNSVKNRVACNGKKYIEVSDGLKILLVASDVFEIVRDRNSLVEKPFLESVLQELKLCGQVSCIDIYRDFIYERKCLSLYERKYFVYDSSKISIYGQLIHKIDEFSKDPHVKELSACIHMPLEKMLMEMASSKLKKNRIESVEAVDLCQSLLGDFARFHADIQIKRKEQERIEKARIQERKKERIKETKKKKETEAYKKNPADFAKAGNSHTRQQAVSVLRMTPEGFWICKDREAIYNQTDHNKKYVFPSEEMVKQYLDEVHPYLVTAPVGYLSECTPEIKKILTSDQIIYVPLTDYYMYLWFRSMTWKERRGKHVAMIEYYDHWLYVSGYAVDASGDSYRRGFCGLKIIYNRTRGNIIKDILKQKIFSGKEREKVLIFRTFQVNAHIDHKMDDKEVDIVNETWENLFKTGQKEMKQTIWDLSDRTKKAAKGGA